MKRRATKKLPSISAKKVNEMTDDVYGTRSGESYGSQVSIGNRSDKLILFLVADFYFFLQFWVPPPNFN